MSSTDATPWPLPPLIPGDWRTLAGPDVTAIIARYAAAEVDSGLDAVLDQAAISRARACQLVCAPNWLLIEAEARMPDDTVGLMTIFFGPDRNVLPAVWAPYVVAGRFWERAQAPVDLKVVKHFVLLAVNSTIGDEHRFRLIDSGAELLAIATDPGSAPDDLIRSVKPVTVEPRETGYAAKGTVVYGDSVFLSEFSIDLDGQLLMTDDTHLQELPTKLERFVGPLRIARTTG